jgi:hypothetical protein
MLLLVNPTIKLTLIVRAMETSKARSTLRSILTMVWSYFALNLPYALLLVAESIGHVTKVRIFTVTLIQLYQVVI